jgi:hypothetical protein
MQSAIHTQLAKQLYELRDTARIVPFVSVGIGDGSAPDDWKPVPRFCHANVDTWVWRCPEYQAVRGWVIFDFRNGPPVTRSHFQFVSHSVIAAPDGRLLDITPAQISQPYPFIRHPGTNDDFDRLVRQPDIMFINHYLDEV